MLQTENQNVTTIKGRVENITDEDSGRRDKNLTVSGVGNTISCIENFPFLNFWLCFFNCSYGYCNESELLVHGYAKLRCCKEKFRMLQQLKEEIRI